jgi:hypothetical protein
VTAVNNFVVKLGASSHGVPSPNMEAKSQLLRNH